MSSYGTPDTINIGSSGTPIIVGQVELSDGVAGHPILGTTANPMAVNITADGYNSLPVVGAAASGSPVTGNPVLIAGSDGTNARTFATDGYGDIKVIGRGITGNIPITFGDPGTEDMFGQLTTTNRIAQIQMPFYQAAPSTLGLTITATGTGASYQGTGDGYFSTGSTNSSEIKAVTTGTIGYSAHFEIYAAFTASFTSPVASTAQRIGLYNTTDGFSFGYNGTVFGIWTRFNSVDTFIAQASWNTDTLSSISGTKFTNAGVATSLVQTNINLYRIRFGWLGIAPVVFEVLSPDGNFVIVHAIHYPNTQITPSITNPNLPMTLDITNAASGNNNMIITCGCWTAGVTSGTSPYLSGSGIINATNGYVAFPISGHTNGSITITGTWTGTLTPQFSNDGLNWVADRVFNTTTGTYVQSITSNTSIQVSFSGQKQYRIFATSLSGTSATIAYSLGLGISALTVTNPSIGANAVTAPISSTQVGGVYNLTPPVVTSGNLNPLQIDASGNMLNSMATIITGENSNLNRLMTAPVYNYTYLTASALVKTGPGVLARVTILSAATTAVLTISDQTSNAVPTILVVTPGALTIPVTLHLDCAVSTGIYVNIATAALSVVISWL